MERRMLKDRVKEDHLYEVKCYLGLHAKDRYRVLYLMYHDVSFQMIHL